MMLTSMKFREAMGRDTEWTLDDLVLSQTNLLVGKNATGKSRTLNVIHFLSTLLTGQRQEIISSGSYETVFKEGASAWKYQLQFNNSIVVKEDLFFNGEAMLHRTEGGIGRIRTTVNDETGETAMLKFQVPGARLATVAKRDAIQHGFLTPLFEWAESVRIFRFGGKMNPDAMALALKDVKIEIDERETSVLLPIFHKAHRELGDRYTEAVIADMKLLGYDLESIAIRRPRDLIVNAILPGEVHGIAVKERDIQCLVDQTAMSQGMFRALSLVAQVNYYWLTGKHRCLLVDDIGEGLDFERSCAVVELLRGKAQTMGFQVIMATNDRFVMNKVPIEEWSVLRRQGNRVRVYNHENAREAFEEWKFTGLSNFDFFATDFLDKEEEAAAHA